MMTWRRSAGLLSGLTFLLSFAALSCGSVVTTDGNASLDAPPAEADDADGVDRDDGVSASTVDGGSSPTTEAEGGAPSDASDRVAASFDTFVADWDNLNETLHADDPDIDRIELSPADFVQVDGVNGDRIFAGQVTETAIIGGTIAGETDAVPTVVIGVDPDGETAAPAVITTFGITAAAGESLSELISAYTEVAEGPIDGDAYLVSGTNDFVIQKVEGAEADDPLLLVTVAPTTDREQAGEAAAAAQVAVFNALVEHG